MSTPGRFPAADLEALHQAKIIGVRAGSEHGYTGVWVVVVEGRVFVRSWNDKPTGWFRAFLDQPLGGLQIGKRELAVRARRTRSEDVRKGVTRAYAEKYDTKASLVWVTGFAEAEREQNTLELVPA